MRWKPVSLAIIITLLALASGTGIQHRLESIRASEDRAELLYIPNDKLITHFTAGLSGVFADILWIQCINYTGAEREKQKEQQALPEGKREERFNWLLQMCRTITRLDPYFTGVYKYGGLFLAGFKLDTEASVDFLKQGIVKNPYNWEIPFDIAMVYYLNDRNTKAALAYLNLSIATGKAPERVLQFADNLKELSGDLETERTFWRSYIDGADPMMRDMADRKLKELAIRENLGALKDGIKKYEDETGSKPSSLGALFESGVFDGPMNPSYGLLKMVDLQDDAELSVLLDNLNAIDAASRRYSTDRKSLPDSIAALHREGYLEEMPKSTLNGTYFIDGSGEAQSTVQLDHKYEIIVNRLRFMINRIYEAEGRYPRDLEELTTHEKTKMPYVPKHPYIDRDWSYNPETGELY